MKPIDRQVDRLTDDITRLIGYFRIVDPKPVFGIKVSMPQYYVLETIMRNRGCYMTKLCNILHLKRNAATDMINRLEGRDFRLVRR